MAAGRCGRIFAVRWFDPTLHNNLAPTEDSRELQEIPGQGRIARAVSRNLGRHHHAIHADARTRRGRVAGQHALPDRDTARRRRVLHRRHGRVLVAHQGRAQAYRRDRRRGGARQMRRHRPHRLHVRARNRRADAPRRNRRRRLRDHDDAVLSAHRRGDGLRLVLVRRRARQHRHLAVRHAVFRPPGDLAGRRPRGSRRSRTSAARRSPARSITMSRCSGCAATRSS